MIIIANRNSTTTNDRFGANLKEACKGRRLNIAVAFFTDYNFINDVLASGAKIQMIVRLNRGTSPNALRKVFGKENLTIRYFTSTKFHPKMYLVEHRCAFVGSSNLTQSAFGQNNEINVMFDYEEDEETYNELDSIFKDFWEQAVPLDKKAIDELAELEKQYPSTCEDYPGFEKKLGNSSFENTTQYGKKDKKRNYIDSFKREYQEYLAAYERLTRMYNKTSGRKWIEEDVPLRIEIDRFLWWIREYKCPGPNGWVNNEVYPDDKIQTLILECKKEYLDSENSYLEKIAHNYKNVEDGFSSPKAIKALDEDHLFKILINVHAFHDIFRFQSGGLDTLEKVFFTDNTIEKIKKH